MKIQNIKKGETFYECECGINVEYVATTEPYRAENDSGWAIYGQMVSSSDPTEEICSEPTWFFANDSYPAYAPKLYPYPEYC